MSVLGKHAKKPNHQKAMFSPEIFIFKMVTMKTKCLMWVETKLKNVEGPITQPVLLAYFTYCNGIETVCQGRDSRNTVVFTDDEEGPK